MIFPTDSRSNQFLQSRPSHISPGQSQGVYGGNDEAAELNSTHIPKSIAERPVTKIPSRPCAIVPTRVCMPDPSSRNSATLRGSSYSHIDSNMRYPTAILGS